MTQGIGKDVGILRDDSDHAAQVIQSIVANIVAADPDLTARGIPEAQDEVCQCALARAAEPNYRDPAARSHVEADLVEDEAVLRPVGEAHPVELQGHAPAAAGQA